MCFEHQDGRKALYKCRIAHFIQFWPKMCVFWLCWPVNRGKTCIYLHKTRSNPGRAAVKFRVKIENKQLSQYSQSVNISVWGKHMFFASGVLSAGLWFEYFLVLLSYDEWVSLSCQHGVLQFVWPACHRSVRFISHFLKWKDYGIRWVISFLQPSAAVRLS